VQVVEQPVAHPAVHPVQLVVQVVQPVVHPVQLAVQVLVQPAVQLSVQLAVQLAVHGAVLDLVQLDLQPEIELLVHPAAQDVSTGSMSAPASPVPWPRMAFVRNGTSDITSNPAAAITTLPSLLTKARLVTSGSSCSDPPVGSPGSCSSTISSGSSLVPISRPLFDSLREPAA
jgi:hypothetical protein